MEIMVIAHPEYPTFRERILQLYLESFSVGLSAQALDPSETASYLESLFEEGYAVLFMEGEELIGALLATPLSFDRLLPAQIRQNFLVEAAVYIAEMMVSERFRGHGLGRKLLEVFMNGVDRRRYQHAFIRVWEGNLPAISLYRKMGFVDYATIDQLKRRSGEEGTFLMHKVYLYQKIEEPMQNSFQESIPVQQETPEHIVGSDPNNMQNSTDRIRQLIARTVDLQTGDPEDKRREISEYFEKTWEIDERLYQTIVNDGAFYMRADPLRHPLIFYLGHTAAFFINKLFQAKLIDTRIEPRYESIFAIGVDEMSWDDLDERHYDWPLVAQVRKYRERAREAVRKVMREAPLELPITWESPFWPIMMGIEHARIHFETSSVLIRQLPLDQLQEGLLGEICPLQGISGTNELKEVPEGEVILGKPFNHPLYGWDLEYGRIKENVLAFKTTTHLISNGEFFEFVDSGGYETKHYWTEEGWNWKNFKAAEMPLFWHKKDNEYFLRLMASEAPMPWNWPVEVNYLEAKAYCNWQAEVTGKPLRLPTEAEWFRLLDYCHLPDQLQWAKAPGNIALEHFASPCPVDLFETAGFFDVIGNVWQWTETPITGFPGYKVHPLYDDFSAPTFDGQHNLIKGGSWISTGNEATRHARYAFRRHFYQHAGFRMVESETPLVIREDVYETDAEVTESCEFNWGEPVTGSKGFPNQVADIAAKVMQGRSHVHALDLNCDTGRTAFEMARHFDQVTALDYSARFIRVAIDLQEKGFVRYIVKDEGDLVIYREVLLESMGLTASGSRITFMQADANNLKPLYSGYDLIVAANLLEELVDPRLFLSTIHERINDGGVLILGSTYRWNEWQTPKERWPGGFKQDGELLTSYEGIRSILGNHFKLMQTPFDLPLQIRKSSRSFEQHLCEISLWQKVSKGK